MSRFDAFREAFRRATFALESCPSSCWTDPATRERLPRIIGVDKPYVVTPRRIEWDAA